MTSILIKAVRGPKHPSDKTTYFRFLSFFIALNLLYCNFLKFLVVTEEWNPAVRARGWIQPIWPKKPKLTNIKLLSLTYYSSCYISLLLSDNFKHVFFFKTNISILWSFLSKTLQLCSPKLQVVQSNCIDYIEDSFVTRRCCC